VLTLIKKLWVKWDGMNIDCVCEEHHKKCVTVPGEVPKCKEYITKFVEVDRTQEEVTKQIKDFGDAVKKFEKEVQKKVKLINKHRIR
jgi:hypothetical protein